MQYSEIVLENERLESDKEIVSVEPSQTEVGLPFLNCQHVAAF
jgi:hypothetical protein